MSGLRCIIPSISYGAVANSIKSRLGYFKGAEENPYGDGHSAAKIASYLINTGK